MSFNDLTGKVFNEWTVLYRDINREQEMKKDKGYSVVHWKCKCSCGTIKSIPGSNLTRGKTKSCGCVRPTPPNFVDLTGQKFGRLTVFEREETRKGIVYWKCYCDCGEKVTVQSGKLVGRHTKSCGCLQKERATETHFKDLTGKVFGKLYVLGRNLEYQQKNDSTQTYWNCICECGTKTVVTGGKLVSGHTKSCGCISSFGELKIKQILNDNNIRYKTSYTFDDCLSANGKRLKFDFGILNNEGKLLYLIEFDGVQHFINENRGWMRGNAFKELRQRDLYKNKYCFDNNIHLIRIPYVKLEKININDLLLNKSKYILTKGIELDYYKRYIV